MRRLSAALLAVMLALTAAVASAQTPPPGKLEPLPEAPPPPPMSDPMSEPQVNIPVPQGGKVEEIRNGGEVVAVKVTPKNGPPYYLINAGKGSWVRRNSLDDGVRVPMWPIKQFD